MCRIDKEGAQPLREIHANLKISNSEWSNSPSLSLFTVNPKHIVDVNILSGKKPSKSGTVSFFFQWTLCLTPFIFFQNPAELLQVGQGEADGEIFLRRAGRHVHRGARRLPLQVSNPGQHFLTYHCAYKRSAKALL